AADAHRYAADAEQGRVHRLDLRRQLHEQPVFGDDDVLQVPLAEVDEVAGPQVPDLWPAGDDPADVLVAPAPRQRLVRGRVVPADQVVALAAVGDARVDRLRPDLVADRRVGLGPVVDEHLLPAATV